MERILLQAEHITKKFPGVVALVMSALISGQGRSTHCAVRTGLVKAR